VASGGTYAAEPQATRWDSVPRLLRPIKSGDHGSPVVRFGHLNDDGLLDAFGEVLFLKPMNLSQLAMIGRFRTDLSRKQAFYIARKRLQGAGGQSR